LPRRGGRQGIVLRRFSVGTAALGLICSGCPVAGPASSHSVLQFNQVSFLGPDKTLTVDHLARGFLVSGEPQVRGFGYYVYLLFQPEASPDQRLVAADAFLAYPGVTYQELHEKVERERLALLGVPVLHPRVPLRAPDLVADYDSRTASIIASRVEGVHRAVPAVALVAYPEPIERGTQLDAGNLLVTDACGDPQQVRIKFSRLRQALVTGERDGPVLQFAEVLGRFFLTGSTVSCQ
jgi:hypothetical protein